MQPTSETTTPETNTPKLCTLCGAPKAEPYGPGRSLICRPCAGADPERRAIANMYYREASEKSFAKAVKDTTDALRLIFPNLVVIDASNLASDDSEPCQCPVCKAAT